MGLNLEVGGSRIAEMSYTRFTEWRLAVLQGLGIDTDVFKLYLTEVDMSKVPTELSPLILHDDTEGTLSPEELSPMIPLIEKSLAGMTRPYDIELTNDILCGMKNAIHSNTPVVFG